MAALTTTVLAVVAAPVAVAAPKSIAGFIGGSAGVNTGGLFTQPRDIAVFTGGDGLASNDKIFVVEGLGNNSRVHRLDGDGNFELLWGRDTIRPGAPGDTGSGFEVCTDAVSGAANCKSAPSGSGEGEFDSPGALAVSQTTGEVYVFDRDNGRVQQFTINGGFIRAWGSHGTGAAQFGPAAVSAQRVGIAVSPVAPHDVFVADAANRRVMQFEADGTFVRGWGFGVSNGDDAFQVCVAACQAANTTGSTDRFANGWPRDIAIDGDGIVYASDGTDGRIVRFDSDLSATPATALLAPLPSPALLAAGTTVGLEIDPDTGNLLVGRDSASGPTVVQEVADPGADLVGPPAPAVVDTHTGTDVGTVQGIGFSSTNENIYLAEPGFFQPPVGPFVFDGECAFSGGNRICAGMMVLAAGVAPTLGSGSASDIGATTADVQGSVDVGGGVGAYRFEISRDGVVWDPAGGGYVAGSGSRQVAVGVSDLQPATPYRLRLSLSKQSSISTFDLVNSSEVTFLTDAAPPDVQTLGSTARTGSGAQLRGRVDPNGSDTSYSFEYGPAGGSFDHRVPVPDAPAGSGNSPKLVSFDLQGLQPGTAYQYRIVATNFVGTSIGDPVVFETGTADAISPTPGRGFELVSPSDKLSGVGVGEWYAGPAMSGLVGQAAYGGERYAAQGVQGSVLLDGAYAWATDWALADRTPAGWVNRPAASRRGYGTQYLTFLSMRAAAADLSLIAWSSNGHSVAPFPEMAGWDDDQVGEVLLLRDWVGAWEPFVGTTGDLRANRANAVNPVGVAGGGSAAVASGRNLGGAGDPSGDGSEASVFVNDLSAGLSDSFPGDGVRRAVNVCTDGTEFPEVVDMAGVLKQSAQECPPPEPDRYARLIADRGAVFSSRPGALSEAGDRVFFTSGEAASCSGTGSATNCPSQLYTWQRNGDGSVVTRWLSRTAVTAAAGASADQDASLMSSATFEGASKDGDKLFFSSNAPLTADDRNGQGVAPPPGGLVSGDSEAISRDLFMYDLAAGDDPADGGQLTRITAGPNGDGDCNAGNSQPGALRYVSENGDRVYFTCAAPLPGVGVAGSGTITDPVGVPTSTDHSNLYLYDENEDGHERWRFIARLPRTSVLGPCATRSTGLGDGLAPSSAKTPDVQLAVGNNCVRGTPDGSTVTFWSDGALTGDDPDSVTGDVYAYDAVADALTRVSAPAGGIGGTYQCGPGGASAVQCYGDGGIGSPGGSNLPRLGVGSGVDGVPVVFFASKSRLLAADQNSSYDVYQWRGGVLTLVSGGAVGSQDVFFAGNDREGRNVYLATRDRLTWQDTDAVMDVYTARVDGGISQPTPPPVCGVLGDGCQGQGAGAIPPIVVDSGRAPAVGDANPSPRVSVSVARVSRKALRRAGRNGAMVVRVRLSRAASVRVVGRARLGKRVRVVASSSRRASRAGIVRLRLRLSPASRRVLVRRRKLAVRLVAQVEGARPVTRLVVVRRAGR